MSVGRRHPAPPLGGGPPAPPVRVPSYPGYGSLATLPGVIVASGRLGTDGSDGERLRPPASSRVGPRVSLKLRNRNEERPDPCGSPKRDSRGRRVYLLANGVLGTEAWSSDERLRRASVGLGESSRGRDRGPPPEPQEWRLGFPTSRPFSTRCAPDRGRVTCREIVQQPRSCETG